MPGHPGPGGDGLRGISPMAAGTHSRGRSRQESRDEAGAFRGSAILNGGLAALLVFVVAGCAAHQSEKAKRQARDSVSQSDLAQPPEAASVQAQIDEKTREHREAAAANKPETVEGNDAALARALKAADAAPTAENLRRAAVEYRRVKVYDQAHDFFKRAIALDPKNAAAFDGLARTWRDWGLPSVGLSHAYKAVYLAPEWAAAQNTLGTLLFVLGNNGEARRRFERAVALDPKAAYALNNLCYLSFTEGDETRAITECHEALGRDPGLTIAHNNLALAHAAAGQIDLAEREFLAGGSRGIGFYNLGIVHMARRDYPNAAVAFDTAFREKPSLWEANVRAREARTLAARPQGPGGAMRN
jgi:Flp pilus assembly protein TadD